MFELIYSGFFLVLLAEVVLFLFLNLPTPKGWKSKIINFLNTNKSVKTIMKVHLGLCVISGIFFLDCMNKQSKYQQQKQQAKRGDSLASELKYSYLSFMTLKIQRNKYITFMLIYATLALNAQVWILKYMYDKRESLEQLAPPPQQEIPRQSVK